MRLELTRVGLLVELANHYTTRGANIPFAVDTIDKIWSSALNISSKPKPQDHLPHLLCWLRNLYSTLMLERILLAYGLPKETVAAITILYRNTKVKVGSPDGDTEYFDIVAGVLQGDTLAPYLFIICLDYVLRTSIDKIRENGFELTKKRSRRYPAKTITTPTTPMT